jgi:hypothetical protein
MQLFDEEDIVPYDHVDFNTPDVLVDHIKQKRIEEGVPKAELPSRPPPPRYTRNPPTNGSPGSLSFEPLMTHVSKRTLPSTANVTFADTSTTVDAHSQENSSRACNCSSRKRHQQAPAESRKTS